MSGGIGLGLGLDFIPGPESSISVPSDFPSHSSPGPVARPAHPAYARGLSPRSHRGPRSLGIGKRFVSAPSPTLPPTIYDRTSSNPLALSPHAVPVNSPQLGLDLVHINPSQHLRAMKKRSIAKRNFGLGAGDPLTGQGLPMPMSSTDMPSASAGSPTVGSSPTLGPGSPVLSPSMNVPEHHVDMLGPSIALSVILGIIVIGVAGWAGLVYRRRQRSRLAPGRERDSDEKSFTSEMFAASNVVEKGLKPRRVGSEELRSSFISYKPPGETANDRANGGRRVSFADAPRTATYDPSAIDQDLRSRRQSMVMSPRVMTAALTEANEDPYDEDDEPFPQPSPRSSIAPTLERIEEEEGSVRSSPTRDSIDRLGMALEEADIADAHQLAMERPRPGTVNDSSHTRALSIASSSSSSSVNSSDYTTASARSSISSLSALSILSSSFPPTPRDPSTPPPTFTATMGAQDDAQDGQDPTQPYDSPTPISKFQTRRKRAQSQGVMQVKHDLLRTAVGRTMSLQPSKEVAIALRQMTDQAEVGSLPERPPPVPDQGAEKAHTTCVYMDDVRVAALVVQQLEDEAEGDLGMALGISPGAPQAGAACTGETGPADWVPSTGHDQVPLNRSTSFPAKLLDRRGSHGSSSKSPASPIEGYPKPPDPVSRRSEIISSGYLKRALRAFRAENDGASDEAPVPSNIPIPCRRVKSHSPRKARQHQDQHHPGHRTDLDRRADELESMRELAQRQMELERFLALIQSQSEDPAWATSAERATETDTEADTSGVVEDEDMVIEPIEDRDDEGPAWDPEGYALDIGAFDECYLYYEGAEDDEPEHPQNDRRTSSDEVPHIRVTSH
ncbi:hypothetical protein IAU60_000865 [Kwoniella sp. DSM 27419]